MLSNTRISLQSRATDNSQGIENNIVVENAMIVEKVSSEKHEITTRSFGFGIGFP
jgi:hypothetical protein